MPQPPAPASPGRDGDPAGLPGEPAATPDWMTAEDWEAWCDATAGDAVPPAQEDDEEEQPDPAPGECAGLAGFAAGGMLDVMPGCGTLAVLADAAAGDDGRLEGASDQEVAGLIAAWNRIEAHASARKHAAVAEFVRRRPEPGGELAGPERMPRAWDEFAADELRMILAESAAAAERVMGLACDLAGKLPGTMAAFLAGTLSQYKVSIIAAAAGQLDEAEARAMEELVLGRAGRLTPGGLRAAVARAVMEVAPEKARKRRETAARDARVQRWAEDSGNAALMGRELPPAEVLAADQRITAWAHELRKAGLEGSMDELRARAYLDLLLSKDSRPASPGGADPDAGTVPDGFAGRVTLTVPLATAAGQADRPAELGGFGPVDPWLARDLAAAAARNPRTAWCVTMTDEQGHAVGHGCARPVPRHRVGRAGSRDGPGFTFTPASRDGPPGTWILSTPGGDYQVTLDPLGTEPCDHRFAAPGHDPGVRLRHLAQIRHATCVSPVCRRPAAACDFEHNVPYEAGGRTCLCNGGPKCRHDHRLKQQPRWKVGQLPDGTFRWTTPSGRAYTTEPTRYPI